MSDRYDEIQKASKSSSSIADLDLYYADMPGKYIDDVLASDLPGSHLDNLLYGELPGSHLDVVLKAPLPGSSTDELLTSTLPGMDPYGPAPAVTHVHSHYEKKQAERPVSAWENYEQKRREKAVEENRKEYLRDLEQKSFEQAKEAQNRINSGSVRGLDDLDNIWKTVRKNIEAGRNERKYRMLQKSRPTSTPVTRARNTSTFARSQIKKENPKVKLGFTGVFFAMILLLAVFNRIIIPLAERFNPSHKVEGTSDQSGGFYLSDSEFDAFVNIEKNITEAFKSEEHLFEMSVSELADQFAAHGFETQVKEEENTMYGQYVDGTTWVDVYRNNDYIGFSCDSSSDRVDTGVVQKAFSETAPVYVSKNLGRDISEVGIDKELLQKFSDNADENGRVTYNTDNFSIYYYEYDGSVSFYLYGLDEETYISVDTDREVLESIITWY